MQFNSFSYLLLLIPAVGLFWALPVPFRRWYVLLLSLSYYATWNVPFVLVPLLLCVGVHLIAREVLRSGQIGRRWFWAGVAYVLLIFAFFRYRQFFLDNLNAVFSSVSFSPIEVTLRIAVPLGISFYCFEAISYLIDMKQGRIKTSQFSNLYLFVMFWPHLMAGPIVRFRELVPQFTFARKFDVEMLMSGMNRLILGLIQKNLIANSLGGWVDEGFLPNATLGHTFADNWTLALAFGLQIYFDFASYSNMAIGVAKLIGVTLPENFRFPYHAHTPADFWSRWHMTLSRWVRDYLFFPVNARLGGAPGPLYASLLGVMALVGLWHGAGWGFVVWGLLHGGYLVLYRIWENSVVTKFPSLAASRISAAGWRVFTIVAVLVAWVPFRAANGSQTFHMLKSMLIPTSFGLSYSVNFYLFTLSTALFCILEPYIGTAISRAELWVSERHALFPISRYGVWPLAYAVGLFLFAVFDDRNQQFIYFQF